MAPTPVREYQLSLPGVSRVARGNNQDLIFQMWNSLNWARAAQVSFMIVVLGVTVALVSMGLGRLVNALMAAPALWPAAGGIAVAAATGVGARVIVRRGRRRRAQAVHKPTA